MSDKNNKLVWNEYILTNRIFPHTPFMCFKKVRVKAIPCISIIHFCIWNMNKKSLMCFFLWTETIVMEITYLTILFYVLHIFEPAFKKIFSLQSIFTSRIQYSSALFDNLGLPESIWRPLIVWRCPPYCECIPKD